MKGTRLSDRLSPILVSSLVLYGLLLVLVLVFSNRIFLDFAERRRPPDPLIAILGAAFSVLLLAFIVASLLRLSRERRRGRAGAAFRLRIALFFLGITLLSSLPHTLLSVNYLSTILTSSLAADISASVQAGLEAAIEYDNIRADMLRLSARLAESDRYSRGLLHSPDQSWSLLRRENPYLDSLQIFDAEMRETAFFGDALARTDSTLVATSPDGLLARESHATEAVILRYRVSLTVGGQTRILVFASVVNPAFVKNAARLADTQAALGELSRFGPSMYQAGLVFYGLFSLPIILVAFLVSLLLSEALIQPIAEIEEATRRVAEGDFSFRILNRHDDPLAALTDSFNRMVSEVEKSRHKLLQTEKVEAWQEIALRLAHEIKNPLTPIKLAAQRILKKNAEGAADLGEVLRSSTSAIIAEADNLDRMITEFKNFSRLPAPAPEPVDLRSLVADLTAGYTNTGLIFDLTGLPADLSVPADPAQLRQVFTNLIRNAVDALPAGRGTVTIAAGVVSKGANSYCRIHIIDTGSGIPEEHRAKVFNPYFTTKPKGSGLGLPIAERIVCDHGGQMWFESRIDRGTHFFIDMPMECAT